MEVPAEYPDCGQAGSAAGAWPFPSTSRGPVRVRPLIWTTPAALRVVYATVLREGSQDDVREWIHQSTLLAIWDSLWLPPTAHEAWDGWIHERRVHVAV